jgi:hypothetical protein
MVRDSPLIQFEDRRGRIAIGGFSTISSAFALLPRNKSRLHLCQIVKELVAQEPFAITAVEHIGLNVTVISAWHSRLHSARWPFAAGTGVRAGGG